MAFDPVHSIGSVLSKVAGLVSPPKDNAIPNAGDSNYDDLGSIIQKLVDESKRFDKDYWANTRRLRQGKAEPIEAWKDWDRLSADNDFDVFGHRNTTETQWEEVVEGEIQRQMRVRSSHITANWHDVVVQPNINGINEIFDQKRETIDWGEFVKEYAKHTQQYGGIYARVIIDKGEHLDGEVTPLVCNIGTVHRTPETKSLKRRDGCWYVIHEQVINDKQIREQYPDLKVDDLSPLSSTQKNALTGVRKSDYEHTKLYLKLECFMDDDSLEELPVSQDEQAQINQENQLLAMGIKLDATDGQHHAAHIEQKKQAAQNALSVPAQTPEDQQMLEQVSTAFGHNIGSHTNMMKTGDIKSLGYQSSYEFGRYICVIGGKVPHNGDIPNPYKVAWRRLFRELKNESMPGRFDGRGDPEILFNIERDLSFQRSRIEDYSLNAGMAKRFRAEEDKQIKGVDKDDNNPLVTSYYKVRPPLFVQSTVPPTAFQIYQLTKNNARQSLGVDEVTFGNEPSPQSSGLKIETLLQQNQSVIAGDLNGNLLDALTDIVEVMFELYKIFEVEPRQYILNGKPENVILSDLLSFQIVQDKNGQAVKQPLEAFRVFLRPFSNFPNKWENELQMILALYHERQSDGMTPLIPQEAVYDKLAERLPDFGRSGKYYQISKATQIGLEVMRGQQMIHDQAAKTGKTVEQVHGEFLKKATGGNGKIQPQPQEAQ